MYVPPWTIFAGLGAIERRELCNLIANFEATTLMLMSIDRLSDVAKRFQRTERDNELSAFALRLSEAADNLFGSHVSDRELRIRLWVRMAKAFDVDPVLPLSTRRATLIGASVAFKAAAIIATPVEDNAEGTQTTFQKAWQTVKSIGGRQHQDFGDLVAQQAELVAKAVAEAAGTGELTDQQQCELNERIREHIKSLPTELRDDVMRNALASGDNAALALLATGTTAFSIGVGVNLAGFSAYILAAQASAFIPFMSGPAIASTLFMLANPLVSVPAVMTIGYLANRHVNGGQAAKLAAIVSVQLALRGLTADRTGLAVLLNDFRHATASDFGALPAELKAKALSRAAAVANSTGRQLPTAIGELGDSSGTSDRRAALLEGVLSKNRGDTWETATVAGFTAADMLYSFATIDPMVIAAADFSRSEDISDIFQFGSFAEHIASMTSASAAKAADSLRGYVGEQLVAARLTEIGHVVNFPETANNAGFDLVVDGMPFQVKCLKSLDGLREHFSKYPDIPVYANSELAEAVANSGAVWAKLVFHIDGFDREIADLIMTASMEAGEALGDLNVPYFAMAVSSARNLHRIWRGRMPLSDLPFSVVMDASVKGGLSTIGALSGKFIGLLAFGPAGGLVLSGLGGIGALMGAGWTSEQASRLMSSDWFAELDASTDRFRYAVLRTLRTKIEMLEAKRDSVPHTISGIDNWLKARLADDIVALAEVAYDLEVIVPAIRQPAKARACLAAMDAAKVHPLAVEAELTELLQTLGAEPSKTKSAGKKAIKAWESMKTKLPFKA